MHYVELDDAGRLVGVFPLKEELERTEFYDGLLFPVVEAAGKSFRHGIPFPCPWNLDFLAKEVSADAYRISGLPEPAGIGEKACLLLLHGYSPATAELGADHSRGNGYVQRL